MSLATYHGSVWRTRARKDVELPEVYRAVLLLRKKGCKVERVGRYRHRVDGSILSSDALLVIAKIHATPNQGER